MPMILRDSLSDEMRLTIIRVYAYRDKQIEGTLYNPYSDKEIVFHNLTQMLFLFEDLLEELSHSEGVPASSFRGQEHARVQGAMTNLWNNLDPLATFRVMVMFQESATWQGRIGWAEGDQETSFRSTWEFIKLIDSALD